jgi:hypothetical protein
MHHREPKSEIDDTGQFLQGASCTIVAQRFHKEALAHLNNAFDIEYFHWSSPRFTAAFWRQAFFVCTAREWG